MNTIEAVSDSITARAKLLQIIFGVSKKYFDAMSKYILGMNPQEHKRLSVHFNHAEQIIKSLGESVKDVSLETLYLIYERFSVMDIIAADFMLLCSNTTYSRASLSEMSSGQHENMRADINRAILSYEKYLAAAVDDDDIFNFAINVTKAVHGAEYKFLVHHPKLNKLTLELIRKLWPLSTGDNHIYITELINDQKQQILNSTRVNTGTWDDNFVRVLQGHECVIFRYGLSPSTVSMPLSDLFKTLNWKWDPSVDADGNFRKAARSGNNIVVLTRIHGSPIEFDFRGVLDKSFAEKFPVKPLSGLSKNFLARYNTATVLSSASTTDLKNHRAVRLYSPYVDVKYPVRIVVSRLSWAVIETIDGVNYRELGCTLQSDYNINKPDPRLPDAKAGTYTRMIPGSRIQGLLNGAATLPTEYNNIHAENISKTRGDMFDPVAPAHISRFASYEKVVPASEPIKNEVQRRFDIYARARVSDIKNNREWQNLFTCDEFVAAANEFISTVLIKNSLIDKLKSPEYTITQMARISAVVSKFIKSVTRASESIPERTFSEYLRNELNRILVERFNGVIKKAADLMDLDKAWTSNELTLKEFIIAY